MYFKADGEGGGESEWWGVLKAFVGLAYAESVT